MDRTVILQPVKHSLGQSGLSEDIFLRVLVRAAVVNAIDKGLPRSHRPIDVATRPVDDNALVSIDAIIITPHSGRVRAALEGGVNAVIV